jgi:hypothetical protein
VKEGFWGGFACAGDRGGAYEEEVADRRGEHSSLSGES